METSNENKGASGGFTRKNRNGRAEQLCWDCEKATGGYAWSKNLTPIEGWDADSYIRHPAPKTEVLAWRVYDCPEYKDGQKSKNKYVTGTNGNRLSRERLKELYRLIDAGYEDLEIVRQMKISPKTIRKYRDKRKEMKWLN